MSILKREMAPISEKVWDEIDERAKEVLKNILSARKVVNVKGPMGWDYPVVPEGRLEIIDECSESGVCAGKYKVKTLVESRITFELDRWEMDNIIRGAKDINLEPLEIAAKKIALFEEEAVYNGYEKGDISGLSNIAKHNLNLGEDASSILAVMSDARFMLLDSFSEGPFSLIVGKNVYRKLNSIFEGYPLIKIIKDMIGGDVILSESIDCAFMIPYNHEDIEFTIGQDFSIGYESHDDKKVKFFIAESFTFRVLDESLVVKFNI